MKDAQKLIKPLYYFNEGFYYKIDSGSRTKLINKRNELKDFIVLDVTANIIYSKNQFLDFHKMPEYFNSLDVLDLLESLKYKVYRRIKIKGLYNAK